MSKAARQPDLLRYDSDLVWDFLKNNLEINKELYKQRSITPIGIKIWSGSLFLNLFLGKWQNWIEWMADM